MAEVKYPSHSPEYRREYRRKYREKNRNELNRKKRLWRNRTREVRLEKERKYRELNKEKIKACILEYKKNNPGIEAEYSRKKRAIKRNANHIYYKLDEVLNKYGTLCHICNKEIDLKAPRQTGIGNWRLGLHIDHLIPLSKGGDDNIENVRPSHAICNLKKGKYIKQ